MSRCSEVYFLRRIFLFLLTTWNVTMMLLLLADMAAVKSPSSRKEDPKSIKIWTFVLSMVIGYDTSFGLLLILNRYNYLLDFWLLARCFCLDYLFDQCNDAWVSFSLCNKPKMKMPCFLALGACNFLTSSAFMCPVSCC